MRGKAATPAPMAAMPLTKERRSGDDGPVFPFLFSWSDIFFMGALLFRWVAASRGPRCSELAKPSANISISHETEDLSVEEVIPRSAVKLSAMTAGKHVRGWFTHDRHNRVRSPEPGIHPDH